MLWGEQKRFAIEACFLEKHDKWRTGRFVFWIGGVQFGDFTDTMDHGIGSRWGRTFLANSGRRGRADLEQLAPAECFCELYEKYVTGSVYRGPWDRDPYVLDEVGEDSVRDRASIVAFRTSIGTDRIIACSWPERSIREMELASGLLDGILEEYCCWAEQLSLLGSRCLRDPRARGARLLVTGIERRPGEHAA
jgi:hypothetical protein